MVFRWIAGLFLLGFSWSLQIDQLHAQAQPIPMAAANNAAAPAAPASAGVAMAAEGNYVLTPNDSIQIKVFQEDDLTTVARISKDGSITFPLIGTVTVGGKTVTEATKLIQGLLQKDYLVNPQVSIGIMEYSKRRFAVLGQVKNPGYYLIPNEEKLNVLQAIAMAGGYTRIADPSRIVVKRAGNGQVIRLNAKAMARDDQSQQFEVKPDDTITVGESIF